MTLTPLGGRGMIGGALARGYRRAAGGIAAPTDIAGCVLWLDASQITGLADGDKVATWSDLSGIGNHVTQETDAYRPTYKTGILNGKPVIRFDGVNGQGFTRPPILSLATLNSTGSTWFAVVKASRYGGNGGPIACQKGGTHTNVSATGLGISGTDSKPHNGAYDTGYKLATATTALTSFRIVCGLLNRSTNKVEIWINGVKEAESAVVGNLVFNVSVCIGNSYFWRNDYTIIGDIAEIVTYSSGLDVTNRTSVEAYLTAKWAIS